MSRAVPVQRGCGSRQSSGVYLECGLGGNTPLEAFLFDPPLTNVPAEWLEPHRNPILIERDGVWHAVIWVGAESYPSVWDFISEVRVAGASRRVPTTFDFAKITKASRMFFVHVRAAVTPSVDPPRPRVGVTIYAPDDPLVVSGQYDREGYTPSERRAQVRRLAETPIAIAIDPHCPISADRFAETTVPVHAPRVLTAVGPTGWPCLGHATAVRETVPDTYAETDLDATTGRGQRTLPCGHAYAIWAAPAGVTYATAPAVFLALPISGIAMVQKADGTFDPKVEDRVHRAGVETYVVDA